MITHDMPIAELLDEYESAAGSYGRTQSGLFFTRLMECRAEVQRRVGHSQRADVPIVGAPRSAEVSCPAT